MNITLPIHAMNEVNSAADTCKNVLLLAQDDAPEIVLGVTLGVSFSADGSLVLLTGDTNAVLLAGAALVRSGITDSPVRREAQGHRPSEPVALETV